MLHSKKKLLSFPIGVYSSGGGGRLLRRMYTQKESDIISLAISERSHNPETMGLIPEVVISYIPKFLHYFRRWYLRTVIDFVAIDIFGFITKFRLQKMTQKLDFEILHVIDHGPFSGVLCTKEILKKKNFGFRFTIFFRQVKEILNLLKNYGI